MAADNQLAESSTPRSAVDQPQPSAGATTYLATHPALWIAAIDLGLIIIFGIISPGHSFFHLQNFTDMALDASEIVLVAIALSFVLAAGELDISVGSNIILSSVIGAKTIVALSGSASQVQVGTYPHLALALLIGIPLTLVVGVAFGVINGLLVTALGVNSFIATLATMGAGLGAAEVLTSGIDVPYVPTQLARSFGLRNIIGAIPAPSIVTILTFVVGWFFLTKTRFGLRTIALGSSRQSVIRAGIKQNRHLLVLFALVGLAAGVAGVMDYSRFSGTNIGGHQTDALSAIAGIVIGGATLFGDDAGNISVPGALLGTLLAVIVQTGLLIQGLSPFYQPIAIGLILVAAVYLRGRGAGAAGPYCAELPHNRGRLAERCDAAAQQQGRSYDTPDKQGPRWGERRTLS